MSKDFFMQSESSESLSIYLPILNSGGGAKYTSQFFNNDESLILLPSNYYAVENNRVRLIHSMVIDLFTIAMYVLMGRE